MGRRAQIDFIPEKSGAFQIGAKQAGPRTGIKKIAFLIQGEDRISALAETFAKFAEAKINVVALDGVSAGEGYYGAIFGVKPPDVAKATKVLGAV